VSDPRPALALRVRERILRLAGNGGCFVGASLSCTDILVHLYSRVLRVTPQTLDDPDRDYLFLSKGHDVPALYATLAELGYLDPGRLEHHLSPSDSIYWHPNRDVPGVEFHSGSLGHLLSVAIGVALDIRLTGGPGRVYVVLGDGELNEGSIWEGCLVAAALSLDNLVAIVDRNGCQANMRTEDLVPLEPLAEKFRAFGWDCRAADGHDFDSLEHALEDPVVGRPTIVLAETVRGRGVPSLEGRLDRWFAAFDSNEVDALVRELKDGVPAELVSEGVVVR
jgi:transketolase